MEEDMQRFRHIMLYYFKKGKNITETQKKMCAVCGEGAVTDRTCQKWFWSFLVLLTFRQIIFAVGLSYALEDV